MQHLAIRMQKWLAVIITLLPCPKLLFSAQNKNSGMFMIHMGGTYLVLNNFFANRKQLLKNHLHKGPELHTTSKKSTKLGTTKGGF